MIHFSSGILKCTIFVWYGYIIITLSLSPSLSLSPAVVWQLMRAYTLSVLQKLSGSSKPIKDQEIVEWANAKLEEGGKSSRITGFKVIQ